MKNIESENLGTTYVDGGIDVHATCAICGANIVIHRHVDKDEEIVIGCEHHPVTSL